MKRLDADQYHIPVMLAECIDYMNIHANGIYIDGTLGGGGHTSAILDRMSTVGTQEDSPVTGHLLSFDADDVAIEHCSKRFADVLEKPSGPFLHLVPANFSTMGEVAKDYAPVNGVLLDLGVSSYQFDYHVRGFSYRIMAPLDMRFTAEGITAAEVLNTYSKEELLKILFEYGEEPSAKKIVAAVLQRRTFAPFATTLDVREIIIHTIPPHHQPKTLARVFQALRIEVNKELDVLTTALQAIIPLMAPGGRIVVMSYHSLEDRIVKNIFKENASEGILKIITKKPIEANADEQASNPRSRSAKLRVAERM